jgi:hypothetical protein
MRELNDRPGLGTPPGGAARGARKPRHGQIEAAPEEMHRLTLPLKLLKLTFIGLQ